MKIVEQLDGGENLGAMFWLLDAEIIKIGGFEFPEEFEVLVSVEYEHGNVFLDKI